MSKPQVVAEITVWSDGLATVEGITESMKERINALTYSDALCGAGYIVRNGKPVEGSCNFAAVEVVPTLTAVDSFDWNTASEANKDAARVLGHTDGHTDESASSSANDGELSARLDALEDKENRLATCCDGILSDMNELDNELHALKAKVHGNHRKARHKAGKPPVM